LGQNIINIKDNFKKSYKKQIKLKIKNLIFRDRKRIHETRIKIIFILTLLLHVLKYETRVKFWQNKLYIWRGFVCYKLSLTNLSSNYYYVVK